MSDEFENALHRALRPQDPGGDFSARVTARLEAGGRSATPAARARFILRRVLRSYWVPAALAACIIAGFGLVEMRQHALDTARASQARAQLLQALSIASDNINIVRTAVAHEENPDS
jgi:hypothetical protein